MPSGILGRKVGMTQIFDDKGHLVPVTVLSAGPCVVVHRRTKERDGYSAIQVGFGDIPDRKVTKPMRGHFAKAGATPTRVLREFRVPDSSVYEVGQKLTVESFKPGDLVSVTATSKGKGYAGGVRRHGFRRGPMAHGSKYHRGPGSAASRDAARVLKGRRMPGHLGAVRVTVRGLSVMEIDEDKNLLIVKGAVPGPRGALVMVKNAAAAQREKV